MKKIALLLLVILALFAFVACGETPEVPETPETPETPEVPETPETPTYTIIWVDENGNTLNTETVEEGKTPTYTYNVVDTAEWDYTFIGWSTTANGEALSSIPSATANETYYALVSRVKQVYTVTFNTLGGSTVDSQTVEYGNTATMPTAPTYEGYRFVGWSSSNDTVVEVDFDAPITGNVEYFAVWNEKIDVKAFLSALLSGYELNPYSYIPESMRYDYSPNLVDEDDIITDYSSFVDISDITYGFGEQWYMVLENIKQSMTFFNVLSVVETISSTAVGAFNNYFDQNPSDTAHYEFEDGIYNVAIDFDGEVILFVVDYTTTIPVIGETTAQIALSMTIENGEKTVRVQLGDANALSYTVAENSYSFAIKYLGSRTAMFYIEKNNDDTVSGKIYEYLTILDKGVSSSAANFYITEDYVSVVGNKADGLIGFENTICELYDVATGKMIGYEINEKDTILGQEVNFDTLWFNLDSVAGFNSIKYVTNSGDSAKIYLNGLNTVWKNKTVGNFSLTGASRRYDIEFRTQYVTSYDPTSEEYTVHKIEVPMLFVQEDYYETLTSDIKSENKDITASVTVGTADLEKLLYDYEELIPIFIENKDSITEEIIIALIGEKITLE